MRLAEFIRRNKDPVMDKWKKFAEELVPGTPESVLSDHIPEILTCICNDMDSVQTADEREKKSEKSDMREVGSLHAKLRLETGFNFNQFVAEYRALRASILSLWNPDIPTKEALYDIYRFNEAMDELLAEGVERYFQILNFYRDQFIGIISHDLRNPLGAIIMGASSLTHVELDDQSMRIAIRIRNSAERMNRMIKDLLDLTRGRMSGGIPITKTRVDLKNISRQVIAEMAALFPNNAIKLELSGDLVGYFDEDRIGQVISNLVANAAQHGMVGPVDVVLTGSTGMVELRVHNMGIIPTEALGTVFDPLVHHSTRGSLGLGLYIAKQIVEGHKGTIGVVSHNDETVFTVNLPRN